MAQTSDQAATAGYYNAPLRQLLAGCIVSSPGKFVGRADYVPVPGGPSLAELAGRLHDIPGVSRLPYDCKPEEAQSLHIPNNLFSMGQQPSTLDSLIPDENETTPSGLKLKAYQRQAVTFLRSVSREMGGCILGADPGLGKTNTTLQALWLDGYLHRPGLVIGPLGAQAVWCAQGGDPIKHYQLPIIPITENKPNPELFKLGTWFFIHYDILRAWSSWISMYLKPVSIVLDESHFVMNSAGIRFKETLGLTASSTVERRYGLTGTPIPKSRMDLFGQLACIQPGQWGTTKYSYGVQYAGAHKLTHHEGQGHWVFDSRTHTDELRARLSGGYLRFSKMDVASDLPKLVRHRISVTLPPDLAAEYRQCRNSVLKWKEGQGLAQRPQTITIGGVEVNLDDEKPKALPLQTTTALKGILDRGKLGQALQTITEVFPGHQRMVVFTWKRDSAKTIHQRLCQHYSGLNNPALHTGGNLAPEIFGPIDGSSKCPWPKRREIAAAFAAAPRSILVATRGSVGIAINDLSAADACLQITPDWNPDGNLQAESRLHREGATAPEIHSYYMLAKGTLDDRILDLITAKSQEAFSLAEVDKGGMNLAADLDPSFGDDDWSMEQICELLEEIEDL